MQENLRDEKLLLKKIRSGDARAFQEVYEAYAGELLDYAARKLASLEEARDITQDVFLSFYERRFQIEIKQTIRSYLFSALKYKIIDYIRKNVHKRKYAEKLNRLSVQIEPEPLNDLVFKDLNEIMENEIYRLPNRVRDVFLLSRRQHLTIKEIAAVVGTSEQTIKNQLSTALKRLRPRIERLIVVIPLFLSFLFL